MAFGVVKADVIWKADTMDDPAAYLPRKVNNGSWFTAYTFNELEKRIGANRIVLPICSLGTPVEELAALAPLVLPPLYHEALDDGLKASLLDRIRHCFPYYKGTRKRAEIEVSFNVVELERREISPPVVRPRVLAFSVDTAVEEHGPHLPLATDTIQSYAVLEELALEIDGFVAGPPVDYGHLTWGLPFGLSIDLTPPLLTRYVTGFANAMLDWISPEAFYVVDVHGSIVHRSAIQEGLAASRCSKYAFRWLHDPLVEFAGERGDQHAGGVETALVEFIGKDLVDPKWWPGRIDEIADGEMDMDEAIRLSPDLGKFVERVESGPCNGIVGKIRNYHDLDASEMMGRMLAVAREDVEGLL